jgi:hypothetical protein
MIGQTKVRRINIVKQGKLLHIQIPPIGEHMVSFIIHNVVIMIDIKPNEYLLSKNYPWYHYYSRWNRICARTASRRYATTGGLITFQYKGRGGWVNNKWKTASWTGQHHFFRGSYWYGQYICRYMTFTDTPTAIKVIARTSDAWGFSRIYLIYNGRYMNIIYSWNGLDYYYPCPNRYWVDGN